MEVKVGAMEIQLIERMRWFEDEGRVCVELAVCVWVTVCQEEERVQCWQQCGSIDESQYEYEGGDRQVD